ncbi:hypothetical protein SSP24_62940 [Streptomyces spinoverrucosus]|uniref:non-specific serine/threonine protein kinase n=1 Tax=Streptomyces spinoverrucosus TaxID=284043 RepID=A0A4Y3VSJ1_9ACTN|nr:serine/threonine-protein kinase [Streptomyces spinoverrucosus]GEC08639.1 hypothetical protein SSP24_62940 [Streptomyces spinoverrucosus]GHB68657.1 hypothetical protein GCM10010397_43670 [Streptomyces spinoverrucosus]
MRLTPEVGDRIAGRYLLREPIGKGGMGVVWLAWDELLHRRVAVKCARTDDARATQRLTREARNAGRLHHPGIVPVFDIVIEAETCWIVSSQIADALAKSHSEGVVHGDVTPENVLVTVDGVARLTDFGISRALCSEVTRTTATTGGFRGKPRYVAPEVARGGAGDAKSDVFSLGASLFMAVEGQSPYGEFENLMGYLAKACEGHVERPHRAGQLTEPLIAMLEVEPRNRPDAAEAEELLRGVPGLREKGEREFGEPSERTQPEDDARSAPPDTPTASLLRPPRALPPPLRHPLTISGTALVVALIVVGLLFFYGPWSSDSPDTAPAGALGDPRTADPCALLDAAALSRFGDTQVDPDYGELDRCDVLVLKGNAEEIAAVEVNFSNELREFDAGVPTRRVGNVEVASLARDGDECRRFISTPDRMQIIVVGERHAAPAPDPCALADAATDHAVSVLDRGPVPRRRSAWPADALARLDACALLDAASLKRVPGLGTRPSERGFGDWNCEWESPDGGGTAFVDLEFTRDNDLEDNGQRAVVAGTTAYVEPEEEGDDSCVVLTPHRTYTNALGDHTVELVLLTVSGQERSRTQLCGTAKSLSATAVRNIARSLPETPGK